MKTKTQNPLKPVPPSSERGAFTAQYMRHGMESTVHYVYHKNGGIRAYVSDYGVAGTPTLTDLSCISTKIKADFSLWESEVRLIEWANDNAMFFTRWRQQADGTLEVIA